jgi:hypothetical protein
MRRTLLAAAAAALTIGLAVPAQAAPQTGCHTQALRDLERLSPQGYAVYQAMKSKKDFLQWIMCDDVELSLTTAVHESVHMLTEEKDGYLLIDGSVVRRPRELERFSPPREVSGTFEKGDIYVQTYLRPGAASSAQDATYLFDELNAYTHDLNSAVKLAPLKKRGGAHAAHRDGLSALMSFVMKYVDAARQQNGGTWKGLQAPGPKNVVRTLWAQAEGVLASSCGIPDFGQKDRQYVGFLCNNKNGAALGELLGRAPACPSQCMPRSSAALQ